MLFHDPRLGVAVPAQLIVADVARLAVTHVTGRVSCVLALKDSMQGMRGVIR